jgi:YVTN family beta-propeller protein
MKKVNGFFSKFSFLLALLTALVSCNKEDPKPKGEFSTGVLVINEGSFKKADGTIGFFDPTSSEIKQDIFGLKNNGKALGDIVQSMFIDGDVAYIPVNNSNTLEVVNSNTFVAEYTLTNVKLPRYFTVYKGKGYLTEWVSFTDPGRVSVINLTERKIETTITTDFGAENIIEAKGNLYVSNNFSNTISVINPVDNKVSTTIEVGSSPGEFVVDSDSKLWVICGGDYSLDNASLHRIDPTTNKVEKSVQLTVSTSSHLVLNKAKDQLLFTSGKNVYRISTKNPEVPQTAFIFASDAIQVYGIGVDPQTDIIYVADAKGFQSNGTIFRYKSDGVAMDNFIAGKGPNGFIFR